MQYSKVAPLAVCTYSTVILLQVFAPHNTELSTFDRGLTEAFRLVRLG
uniref:Uncharacterized protein n=1 Tax=Anguilla anguilla TaxID=7936 RepID=A0A0E9TPB8_ANGAN